MRAVLFAAFATLLFAISAQAARASQPRLLDVPLQPATATAPDLQLARAIDLGGGGEGSRSFSILVQACGSMATEGLLSEAVTLGAFAFAASLAKGSERTMAIAGYGAAGLGLLLLIPLATSGVVYTLARVDDIDASYGKILAYSVAVRVLSAGIFLAGLLAPNAGLLVLGVLGYSVGGTVAEVYAANSGPDLFGNAAPVARTRAEPVATVARF